MEVDEDSLMVRVPHLILLLQEGEIIMSELVEILFYKLFNGLNRSALKHLRPQLSWTDLVKPISKLYTLYPFFSIFNCEVLMYLSGFHEWF